MSSRAKLQSLTQTAGSSFSLQLMASFSGALDLCSARWEVYCVGRMARNDIMQVLSAGWTESASQYGVTGSLRDAWVNL